MLKCGAVFVSRRFGESITIYLLGIVLSHLSVEIFTERTVAIYKAFPTPEVVSVFV